MFFVFTTIQSELYHLVDIRGTETGLWLERIRLVQKLCNILTVIGATQGATKNSEVIPRWAGSPSQEGGERREDT